MAFILDVAAGVLIAAFIIGMVIVGLQVGVEQSRTGDDTTGFLLAIAGIVIWVVFVVCRLFRWP
jgi:hypothetical protein